MKLYLGCIFSKNFYKIAFWDVFLFKIPIKSHFGMYFVEGAHGIPWGGPLGSHGGVHGIPGWAHGDPLALGDRGPWGPGPLGTRALGDALALGDPGPWGPGPLGTHWPWGPGPVPVPPVRFERPVPPVPVPFGSGYSVPYSNRSFHDISRPFFLQSLLFARFAHAACR